MERWTGKIEQRIEKIRTGMSGLETGEEKAEDRLHRMNLKEDSIWNVRAAMVIWLTLDSIWNARA
jgi:hypothetical protein